MAVFFDKEKDEIICPNCGCKTFTEQTVCAYRTESSALEPTIKRFPVHIVLTCTNCDAPKKIDIKTSIID